MSDASNPQLHTHVIWLKGHAGVTHYVFRTAERAREVFNLVTTQSDDCIPVTVCDDFGRTLFARAGTVDAIQLIDCAAELNGQAELQILQAHANVKLQKRAQQDPMLSGRPVIVQPGGGMNGPLPFNR